MKNIAEQREIFYEKFHVQIFFFSIRDYAADVIRDISDVAFEELAKYKIYENSKSLKTKTPNQNNTKLLINQQEDEDYANLVKLASLRFSSQQDFILVWPIK